VFFVALVSAMSALAIDILLPAFSEMRPAFDLDPDATDLSLTITLFFFGTGAGNLFAGPLADSIGRRRLLFASMLLYGGAALVSALLPVFESLSGVTTDVTLLELSDPDRSLLRRLASEAPGTYAHSIAMANLCEAACNAIGAHGLLARIGCYYHDIGKLKKPQYFVENQSGTNPHDKLKPEASAAIVRNHVRDGLQMADEKKLPQVVKDFIAEPTPPPRSRSDSGKSRPGNEHTLPSEPPGSRLGVPHR